MHRLQLALTYMYRRHECWEKPCGCSFKATLFGWRHTQCLNHYLD